MDKLIDAFGLLPIKESFNLPGYKIYLAENQTELDAYVKEYAHFDGFIYPPMQYTATVDPSNPSKQTKKPNSDRPAHLFRMPASHYIEMNSNSGDLPGARRGHTGFIINLLGYLYGTRLQFCDWWVDGRVPYKSQHNIFLPQKTAEKFLSGAVNTYITWDDQKSKHFTTILFMHTRVSSYEWDWERFLFEYVVLDALWKIIKEQNKITKHVKHEDRIKAICDIYGILYKEDIIKQIVRLRNDLFHESLWDKGQPGSGGGSNAFYSSMHLTSLNQRIIPAVLGYKSSYIKSDWTSRECIKF